jgi:hypothetical protein
LEACERGGYLSIANSNGQRLLEGEKWWIYPFASAPGAAAGFGHFTAFVKLVPASLATGRDDDQLPSLGAKTFGHVPDMGGKVFFRNPEHHRKISIPQRAAGGFQTVDDGLA